MTTAIGEPEPAVTLGANLRRVRTQRGLSLERFAKLCGVSRAMLGQIELGQSAPTINVIFKITQALDLPFSALIGSHKSGAETQVLRALKAKQLLSGDGSFSSRALFPYDGPRKVEFYELRLRVGGLELAEAHAPGTSENLVCTTGQVEIERPGERHRLGPGDAIVFRADVPHGYRNVGDVDAVMYLVMTYG